MNEIKKIIFAGLAFGVIFGLPFLFIDINAGIFMGLFSGLLFAVGIYLFLNSRSVKQQTQVNAAEGETIILSGPANHFLKFVSVGGKLYLFKDKLHFKSHGHNIQNPELIIELLQIKEVKNYNILGLIPKGLAVSMKDGQVKKFVVSNNRLWKAEIEKLI